MLIFLRCSKNVFGHLLCGRTKERCVYFCVFCTALWLICSGLTILAKAKKIEKICLNVCRFKIMMYFCVDVHIVCGR